MLLKTEVLVLSALRYQEKSLVVTCFTKEAGLQSYFVRNAFSKTNKGLNSAYFQPLNQLFVDATHKNRNTLEYLSDVKLAHAYQTLSSDFYKNSVCMFLAEVLAHSLKEQDANKPLFVFLKTALVWFDAHDFTPDFHLWFLVNLTKYLGFFPDDSDADALYFNLNDGGFTMQYTPNCLDEDATVLFRKLLHVPLVVTSPVFTNNERREALKLLLLYYGTHIANFKQLKSMEILPELFY